MGAHTHAYSSECYSYFISQVMCSLVYVRISAGYVPMKAEQNQLECEPLLKLLVFHLKPNWLSSNAQVVKVL